LLDSLLQEKMSKAEMEKEPEKEEVKKEEKKDVVIFLTEEEASEPSKVSLAENNDTPPGLILPNGDINWNCPCLGGMAVGPCGMEFRDAFSCFHYSTADPKGSDCIEKFADMQMCTQRFPELYDKDEDREEEPKDGENGESKDGTESKDEAKVGEKEAPKDEVKDGEKDKPTEEAAKDKEEDSEPKAAAESKPSEAAVIDTNSHSEESKNSINSAEESKKSAESLENS